PNWLIRSAGGASRFALYCGSISRRPRRLSLSKQRTRCVGCRSRISLSSMRVKPSTACEGTPFDVVSGGSAWYARKMKPDASTMVSVLGPSGFGAASSAGATTGGGSEAKRSCWLVCCAARATKTGSNASATHFLEPALREVVQVAICADVAKRGDGRDVVAIGERVLTALERPPAAQLAPQLRPH